MNLRETQPPGATSGASDDDVEEPCRLCRGRGYDRHDPDEPCSRCDGEGIETSW